MRWRLLPAQTNKNKAADWNRTGSHILSGSTTTFVGVDNVSNDFVRVPAVSDTDDYFKIGSELSIWLSIPDPMLTVSSLHSHDTVGSALPNKAKT